MESEQRLAGGDSSYLATNTHAWGENIACAVLFVGVIPSLFGFNESDTEGAIRSGEFKVLERHCQD